MEPEEEPEPQFSPVESSSDSGSEDSDATVSTSASDDSSAGGDSGNDSYSSVNHFDSDEEEVNPNNDYRKISLLQETIKLDGHDVNILYDEGATVSLMSTKIKVPIFREAVNRCEIVAEEGVGAGLETCPIVDIPLPLYSGGVGAARVSVTARDFPLMTADPPMEAIADKLDFPVSLFTPRQEGPVQLILGEDNRHLFPLPIVSSMDRIFSLQLWRSRLTGGLLYHGALAGGWKSRRGLSARSSGVLAKIMRGYPFTMTVMMAVMACAMIATPVTGFMAYDCNNASNVVEAYSLLEPAPCHASGFEHRYERIISAEIIQQKRERTIPVFRCHVVESVSPSTVVIQVLPV
jgi:hypothetical protein